MASDTPDTPRPTGPVAGPVNPPPQIIIQTPSWFGRFGKLLVGALVLCIFIIMGMRSSYESYYGTGEGPQEKYNSLSRTATKKIAMITLQDVIVEGECFTKEQIVQVREDPDVVAVVLYIDSPGGTVNGSDYLYHHLKRLREEREIPVVVSMGSVCASGGYYVAMAVGDQPDTIFAEPTSWVGSIGVVIPHFDFSGLLDNWNIEDDSIASGPLKLMGSPTRPMSNNERALLQELVDESFAGFKKIVVSGRPKFKDDAAALDAVATGQIFTAEQALAHGLVDKVAHLEEAIERAAELAGYGTEDLRCIHYEEELNFMTTLLNGQATVRSGAPRSLSELLDLMTPRAYYLWSHWPTVLSNTRP